MNFKITDNTNISTILKDIGYKDFGLKEIITMSSVGFPLERPVRTVIFGPCQQPVKPCPLVFY